MRARIFICYRSSDTLEIARHLYARLKRKFGKENVFWDDASIPKGVDFRLQLEKEITQANIVIILIGEQWVRILNERYENEIEDWVNFEVRMALQKGPDERVIPVLVGDTPQPQVSDLPPNIPLESRTKFYYLNTLKLPPKGMKRDQQIKRLIDEICDWERTHNPPRRQPPPQGHKLGEKLLTAFALPSFILCGIVLLTLGISLFYPNIRFNFTALQTADFKTFPLLLATICEYIPMSCVASGEIGNFINRFDLPVTFSMTTTLSLWLGGLTFATARILKVYKYNDPSLSFVLCLILSALVFVQHEFVMGLFVMYAICMLLMVTSSDFEVEILQIAFVILGLAGVVLLNQIQSSGKYVSPLVQVATYAPLVTLSTKLLTKSAYLAVMLGLVTSLWVYFGGSIPAIEFLRDMINSLVHSAR
jgi:hypothetical protein